MNEPVLSIDDLHALGFEAELETVAEAVTEGRNLAIISEPFGGRNALIEYVEELVENVSRTQVVDRDADDDVVDGDADDDEIDVRIFDDCHRLFRREIGGFDRLDSFLDEMAAAEAVYVTSWNAYAWTYLAETKDVDKTFQSRVTVPTVDAETITAYLEDTDHGYEYVDDTEAIPARFDPAQISSFGSLREQFGLLRSGRADDTPPKEIVFGAITRISNGNPGVARAVWDTARTDDDSDGRTIRTSSLAESIPTVPELDYDDSFALAIIVSNERLSRAELEATVGAPLGRLLRRFESAGIVSIDGGVVRLLPPAVKPVVEHLNSRRLIW